MAHAIAILAIVNQQPNRRTYVTAKTAVPVIAVAAIATKTPAIVIQQNAAK